MLGMEQQITARHICPQRAFSLHINLALVAAGPAAICFFIFCFRQHDFLKLWLPEKSAVKDTYVFLTTIVTKSKRDSAKFLFIGYWVHGCVCYSYILYISIFFFMFKKVIALH